MALPSVLSIAGSDSCGGAGIQADLKTITAFGAYGQTAITAITAQNTFGVQGAMEVPSEFVALQIDSVFTDMRPDAVKIGMVSSPAIVGTIAEKLGEHRAANVVVDPVLVATTGASLAKGGVAAALVEHLLPLATVVTPNISEAQVLSGRDIRGKDDMERAAEDIAALASCPVLLKGGHLSGSADDLLLFPDGKRRWFTGPLFDTPNTHGTGCTLSSAIACGLAKGQGLEDAVGAAKEYVSGAILRNPGMGKGSTGPLNHLWAGIR